MVDIGQEDITIILTGVITIKTQDYLKQIGRLERMCQRKYEEIEHMRSLIYGISGGINDCERVQGTTDQDRLGTSVAKLVDLTRQTDGLIEVLIDKRKHIIDQIDRMPTEKYYVFLTDMYVNNKHMSDISEDPFFNCSEKTLVRIHSRALEEFESIYGEEYLNEPSIFI